MIAMSEMLLPAAERAGIKVPPAPVDNYKPEDYSHWHFFRCVQLGQAMPYPSVHWDNAEAIAKIPVEKLLTITVQELESYGIRIGFSAPLTKKLRKKIR